jgi:hypothetical protein
MILNNIKMVLESQLNQERISQLKNYGSNPAIIGGGLAASGVVGQHLIDRSKFSDVAVDHLKKIIKNEPADELASHGREIAKNYLHNALTTGAITGGAGLIGAGLLALHRNKQSNNQTADDIAAKNVVDFQNREIAATQNQLNRNQTTMNRNQQQSYNNRNKRRPF